MEGMGMDEGNGLIVVGWGRSMGWGINVCLERVWGSKREVG